MLRHSISQLWFLPPSLPKSSQRTGTPPSANSWEKHLALWPQHWPYLGKLAFRDPISIEDDACRLEAGGLVELDEQLTHHVGQVFNDLLPWSLHPHCSTVSAGVGIHAAYYLTIKKKGSASRQYIIPPHCQNVGLRKGFSARKLCNKMSRA